MAIRGRTVDILAHPSVGAEELNELEAFVPFQIEMRNARISRSGAWTRRDGVVPHTAYGTSSRPVGIVDYRQGVAVFRDGSAWYLGQPEQRIPGKGVPIYGDCISSVLYHGLPIICGGGAPMCIRGGAVQDVGYFQGHRVTSASGFSGSITAETHTRGKSGSLSNGEYVYSTTYVTTGFYETGLSVESNIVELTRTTRHTIKVGLQDVLRSAGDDVIAVRVWRARAEQAGHRTWRLIRTLTTPFVTGDVYDRYAENDHRITNARPPTGEEVEVLAPSGAKHVVIMDDHLIMAGHHRSELRWSDAGAPMSWPDYNKTHVQLDGGKIVGLAVVQRTLYVFKDNNTEVWVSSQREGGTPWVRQQILEKGAATGHSIVFANNQLHWLGTDNELYVLDRAVPKPISMLYSKALRELSNPREVYGLHFPDENCIRWFAPSDNKCFVYDYINKTMGEDNWWNGTDWDFYGLSCASIVKGRTYVGAYEEGEGAAYKLGGYIGYMDRDAYQDFFSPIRTIRKFRVMLTNDGDDARVSRLRFRVANPSRDEAYQLNRAHISRDSTDAYRLEGEYNLKTFTGTVMVKWKIDGDPEHTEYFSINDLEEPYFDIHNLGHGREMAIEISEFGAKTFFINAAFLTYSQFGYRRTSHKARGQQRASQ